MLRIPTFAAALVLVLIACASGAGSTAPPSVAPPTASPSVATVTIITPEEAAARVAELVPSLAGIGPRDPNVIGGCCFWEASATDGGFRVAYEVGWGDCPAGCIERHQWTYDVSSDGNVQLVEESGPPVPEGVPGAGASGIGSGGGGGILPGGNGIIGRAVAGPTCPVVTEGDAACDDRPITGATVLVLDSRGTEIARLRTDADGRFSVTLPAGPYTVEPQPVTGLMGTPEPIPVTVADGFVTVDLAYDTGIR
jgi:hypothetical protein